MGSLWHIVSAGGAEIGAETLAFFVEKAVGVGYPDPNNVLTPYGLADGARFQRTVIPARMFALVGKLGATDLREFHQYRQMMIELVRRDRTAEVKPVVVRYIALGGTLEIEAYFQGGLGGDGELTGFNEKLTLRFVAPDPLWRDPTAQDVSLAVNSNTTVDNTGKAETYPVIMLAGEGEIVSLANSTTGQTITFNGLAILPGETVTLDLRPGHKTLSSDVRGNLLANVAQGSPWSAWKLLAGENTVLLTAEAEAEVLDEDGDPVLDENDDPILSGDTLNLTTSTLEFQARYWSIDGVA